MEADLRDADLSDGHFNGSDFTLSQFGNTDIRRADFTDAENYSIDVRTCAAEGAVFSRFEAVRLLESMGLVIAD